MCVCVCVCAWWWGGVEGVYVCREREHDGESRWGRERKRESKREQEKSKW